MWALNKNTNTRCAIIPMPSATPLAYTSLQRAFCHTSPHLFLIPSSHIHMYGIILDFLFSKTDNEQYFLDFVTEQNESFNTICNEKY
jgi:hypothetical protein